MLWWWLFRGDEDSLCSAGGAQKGLIFQENIDCQMNVTWNKISFNSAGNRPYDLLLSSLPHHTHRPASHVSPWQVPRIPGLQISLPLAAGFQNIHGNQSLTPGRRQQNWKAPFCFHIYSSVNWQLGGSLGSIRLGYTFLPPFVSSFYLCRIQPRLRNFSNVYFLSPATSAPVSFWGFLGFFFFFTYAGFSQG